MTQPTPESNAQQIAALTQAIDLLVSQFIRPNAQQHLELMSRMERVEQALERQAEVIAGVDIKLDQVASIMGDLAKAQKSFDAKLEETRQLVAKNASDIAQAAVKHDEAITRLEVLQQQNSTNIAQLIEENRAFRESQQSQLAAIIGNARRIDRLEQQAS